MVSDTTAPIGEMDFVGTRIEDDMMYPLRPAIPPIDPHGREMVLYGGPDDGKIIYARVAPTGYRDTGMAMVYWEPLRVDLIWPKK